MLEKSAQSVFKRIPQNIKMTMAQWVNKHQLFEIIDFPDFEPRKGFKCKAYLEQFDYKQMF